MKVHVRKGDNVFILSGKDKGKKGKVLGVFPDKGTVLVEGVNITTKHKKPRGRYQQGGLIHQESPISSSKVMLVCDKCGQPTKPKMEIISGGQKSRASRKCGETINVLRETKEA